MMKKILSLVIIVVLAASFTTALAAEEYKVLENFDSFDVTVTVPDSMTITQVDRAEWIDTEITYADGHEPAFHLHITPTEEYVGLSFADLSEEEQNTMIATIEEDFMEPVQELYTTPSGNLVLLIKETADSGSFATIQTLYRGFLIYLYCAYDDFAPVTDGDIATMKQIIEGLKLEPVGEVMMPPAE